MKKGIILMTGGGTAGHVNPNLALAPQLLKEGYELHYAGTADGIERKLVEAAGNIEYHVVSSGKLRRYFSMKNLSDPFKVLHGVNEARALVRELKPDVVFSKGGFVSVPVVIGAHGKAPVIIHESDYTPGLANRIAIRYADTVCVTFEDTLKFVPGKGVHTGTPVRHALYEGKRENGLALAGFEGNKPVLLIMGGSLGAKTLNEGMAALKQRLLAQPNLYVVQSTGKGGYDAAAEALALTDEEAKRWKLAPYIDNMGDVLAAADLVLSRAGASSIAEIAALGVPAVLVPYPFATEDHQTTNARFLTDANAAVLFTDDEVKGEAFGEKLLELVQNEGERAAMRAAAAGLAQDQAASKLADELEKVARG